ncbi:MAG: murein biosynthesis integral membrane protein MurJ, partial [Deltaproteobacteria bacterium]|nr:murein biosynthesis integral membrane protein MurJ [Deltaproteobacteria bacterium]
LASGFEAVPGKLELTAYLARLMMPFLLAISVAAVLMGMLNARGRFSVPALAPTLFNVAAIGVGTGLWLGGAAPETAVVGWALGTLLGGILQLAIQVPAVRRDGFRIRPRFTGLLEDPALRRIAKLMAPATLGLAATEVNIFINTQFASTEPGANAWLNYAFRLMYVPIGIFGVAIATVTTSNLARRAAQKDLPGVRAGLSQGLRHVAFLTIPATVGLAVLAESIIGLIYEHGRFTAADTRQTALALMGYVLGLYAYSGVKVTAPAFYSLERTLVPLLGSAAAVATNLVLNLIAYRYLRPMGLGYVGLAVGTSLGALVNLAILRIAFGKLMTGVPGSGGSGLQLLKVLTAAAIMGAVAYGTLWAVDASLGKSLPRGTLLQLVRVLTAVGLGGLTYAAACRVLRVGEMSEILSAVRRRAKR